MNPLHQLEYRHRQIRMRQCIVAALLGVTVVVALLAMEEPERSSGTLLAIGSIAAALCVAIWSLFKSPHKLQKLVITTKPVKVQIAIECLDNGDGREYFVFIDGAHLAESGHSNWRAALIRPFDEDSLSQFIDRNSDGEIWVSPNLQPALLRLKNELFVLGRQRRVVARLDVD